MNSFLKIKTTVKELAENLNCTYKGDPESIINYIGDINYIIRGFEKYQENCIYYAENENTFNHASKNTILLTSGELAERRDGNFIIPIKNLKETFIKLLEYFDRQNKLLIPPQEFISKSCKISRSAILLPGVYIGDGAIIGDNCILNPHVVIEANCRIGNNSVIHSGVHIGHHCEIGSNNIIYSNAVIGSDGFGYTDINGTRFKIPQIGNVVTGNFVEIGACTTVDRSTIESTKIGDNTKIDNQVQIAHNCVIGKNVYIAGKASMAGSVTVEDQAILAGGSAIRDHVTIAKGSTVLGMTGIESDTEPGKTYFGIPARPVRDMHRINSALNQLPEIIKKIKKSGF